MTDKSDRPDRGRPAEHGEDPRWAADYWGGLPPAPGAGDNMNAAMPTRPHSPAAGAQAVSAGSADLIDASHQRSLKYGIAAADEPDFSSPARHEIGRAHV